MWTIFVVSSLYEKHDPCNDNAWSDKESDIRIKLPTGYYQSPVASKPVFGVCDQVRLKLACSDWETS